MPAARVNNMHIHAIHAISGITHVITVACLRPLFVVQILPCFYTFWHSSIPTCFDILYENCFCNATEVTTLAGHTVYMWNLL